MLEHCDEYNKNGDISLKESVFKTDPHVTCRTKLKPVD